MTKSEVSMVDGTSTLRREGRPFLFLDPAPAVQPPVVLDPIGLDWLHGEVADQAPTLARSLVNFSIELQNRSMLERGNRQPIQLSVLNRRRRVARAWVNAVLAGSVDPTTLHAFATQWLPVLCGTGPDARPAPALGRKFVEFLRGAITAHLFAAPADNLLPAARALFALETILASHLAAVLREPVPAGR